MGRNSPDHVVANFASALRRGDSRAAIELFSHHGCFVTPDSTVIRERSHIKGVLQQLIGMPGELTIEQRSIVTAGDIAVSSESWGMRFARAAKPVERTSRSMTVLGRAEGVWRIAVFDPWHA
jgi:ketosteroid isomerase-like protein